MPRRGENIYKRKDGRWEGRVLRSHAADGKAFYSYFYGHSYAEVKQKMALHQHLTANNLKRAGRPLKPVTCGDAAMRWLAWKQLKVKSSTYARYQNLVENHIIPDLGRRSVGELSNESIEQYVEQLFYQGRKDKHGGLSAKTVSDILTILKAILRYMGKQGYEVEVCFDELTVRKSHHEMRVLSVAEQDKLAVLFQRDVDNRCLGVMLSLYTGLRLGEVCALKWENVDLSNRVIHVRSTMQRIRNNTGVGGKTVILITEPKSECSIRDIPIPDFLLPILKRLRGKTDAFVLSGSSERFVEPRTMENYFKRCVAECGIAPANYHSLRHSFATRCVELGFDIKSLSEILGHSNVSITLNRYVHSSFELKKRNMNKLKMRSCA